jgi:hypothetical protein
MARAKADEFFNIGFQALGRWLGWGVGYSGQGGGKANCDDACADE